MTKEITVAIVEDNYHYRSGLEQLLTFSAGFHLAGSFHSGEAALAAALKQGDAWDVIVMDLGLPGLSGAAATAQLKRLLPRVRVVVFTVFEDPVRILEAIAAGADSYAVKSTPAPQVLGHIRNVHEGGANLTGVVARTLLDFVRTQPVRGEGVPLINLTDREQDVLRLLVRGMTYRQIAGELGLGLDTVRTHLRSVYGKLQVHNAAAAVARAVRDKMV